MADTFDPDAYLKAPPASSGFDPDAYLDGKKASKESEPADHGLSERQKLSPIGKALSPITEYPKHLTHMAKEAQGQIAEGWDQMTHPGRTAEKTNAEAGLPAPDWRQGSHISDAAIGAGKVALGNVSNAIAPIMAGVRSVASQPLEDTTGIPREYTEFAAQLATPGIGLRGLKPPAPKPILPPKPPADPFGVTLSEGETTGDLPAIRREQSARRDLLGPKATKQATAFDAQREEQLANAREDVTRQLDPNGGQVLADNPQQAAGLVQQSVQKEAGRAKNEVDQAYRHAESLPGEIHPDALKDMGVTIREELNNRPQPVIVDDGTPVAARMLKFIDDRVSKLSIRNDADLSNPIPSNISGVTLEGVNQLRKALSEMRGDALKNFTNPSDSRAAKAVIDAFDARIDKAVNSGAFRGDPAAIEAWNSARAAHSERMATYGNDAVGKKIQDIIGNPRLEKDPATINAVADFMYGASGTSPTSLHVGVAKRLQKILGVDSPEWAAIRQGYFKKLVGTTEGIKDRGYGTVANRLYEALNGRGSDLANVLFPPAQRDLLRSYADLHRTLEVPRTGAGWSETPTFVNKALSAIGTKISGLFGAVIGHAVAPGMHGAGEYAGSVASSKMSAFLENSRNAKQIAQQMPLVGQRIKQWQQAVKAQQRNNSIANSGRASLAATSVASALSKLGIDNASTMRLLHAGPSGPGSGEAKERADGGRVGDGYDTPLGAADQEAYKAWKMIHAPKDSGQDYDLRGAYKSGMVQDPETNHFGDQFKKPNHPTFSDQSQYAVGDELNRAGHWNGDDYVPPAALRAEGGPVNEEAAQYVDPPADDSWKDKEAKEGLAFRPKTESEIPSMSKRFADYDRGMTEDILGLPGKAVKQAKQWYGDPASREMPRMPTEHSYDPITGAQITPDVSQEAKPEQPEVMSQALQHFAGTRFGKEREQSWPERMVRSGVTLPHDVYTGEEPMYETDPETGERRISHKVIERAQDMAGMAGSGGLGAGATDATLGSAPFLRPALKYNEKIYKAPHNGTHLDAIPPELYPEFERQAMSGEDISHFNFGFMNEKGHFLDRQKALEHGINSGLIDSHMGNQGALTSTLLSDSQKPGAALSALEKAQTKGWKGVVEGEGAQQKPLNTPEQIEAFKAANEKKPDDTVFGMKVNQLDSPQSMMRRGEQFNIPDPSKLRIKKTRTIPMKPGEESKDFYFVEQPTIKPEYVDMGLTYIHDPVTGFSTKEAAEAFIRAAQNKQQVRPDAWSGPSLYSDSSAAGAPLAALEHQTPHAPAFYSDLERALSQAGRERKLSGADWQNFLKNKGAKPEEMDWRELTSFLNDNKNKQISKQDIQDHLEQNKVELKPIVKGDFDPSKLPQDIQEKYGDIIKGHENSADVAYAIRQKAEKEHYTVRDEANGKYYDAKRPFEDEASEAHEATEREYRQAVEPYRKKYDEIEATAEELKEQKLQPALNAWKQAEEEATRKQEEAIEPVRQEWRRVAAEETQKLEAIEKPYREAYENASSAEAREAAADAYREHVRPAQQQHDAAVEAARAKLDAVRREAENERYRTEDQARDAWDQARRPVEKDYYATIEKADKEFQEAQRPHEDKKYKLQSEIDDKLAEQTKPHREEYEKTKKALEDEFNKVKQLTNINTKFPTYQLPGGKNYRERLLQLPLKTEKTYQDALYKKYGEDWRDKWTPEEKAAFDKASGKTNYEESHWEEPDIVAHRRSTDREIEGVKSLHDEEHQSDLHQQGRRKGYQGEEVKPRYELRQSADPSKIEALNARIKELEETEAVKKYNDRDIVDENVGNSSEVQELHRLFDERGELSYEESHPWGIYDTENDRFIDNHRTQNEAQEDLNYYNRSRNRKIPNAPWKESWHRLLIQDQLREAAEKGYNRVSWTAGESSPTNPKNMGSGTEGDKTDLGLQQHYNVKERNAYDKIGKQHGVQSKSGTIEVPGEKQVYVGPEKTIDDLKALQNEVPRRSDPWYYLRDAIDRMENNGYTFARAMERLGGEDPELLAKIGGKLEAQPIKKNIYYMDIPESLRKQILTKGFSLFEDSAIAGAPLAALEHSQPFYSAVEQTVQGAKQQKMHGSQWANWLKNQPGVKPDELQYTGIDKWLRDQNGLVTKEQVADFIDKNKVQVEHVTKSGKHFDEDDARAAAMKQAHDEAMDHFGPQGADRDPDRFHDAVDDRAHELFAQAEREAGEGKGATKHSSYQLPGGKNYQEHLITLPTKQSLKMKWNDLSVAEQAKIKAQHQEFMDDMTGDPHFDNDPSMRDSHNVKTWYENVLAKDADLQRASKVDIGNTYRSSHWDEPNVVAHTRTNEREVGGKPSLHVEENQSDWGQLIRKKGVKGNFNPDDFKVQQKNGRYVITDHNDLPTTIKTFDDAKTANQYIHTDEFKEDHANGGGAPDMPFKQTEQWAGLAMKKMIHKAIENGQERVSWTPGEAQAARYDLSKHIDTLVYNQKTGELQGFGNGKPALNKSNVSVDKLDDYVGKAVADKLIREGHNVGDTFSLRGQDLKVGGEGMKGFYDKMLPKIVEKLGKEWGVKVKQGQAGDQRARVLNDAGQIVNSFDNKAQAESWLNRTYTPETAAKYKIEEKQQPVFYFDIPPKMREDILKKGFPLFSDSGKPGAALSALEHQNLVKVGVPAVRLSDGRIIRGRRGQMHQDIVENFLEKNPDLWRKGTSIKDAGVYNPSTKKFFTKDQADIESTDLMSDIQRTRRFNRFARGGKVNNNKKQIERPIQKAKTEPKINAPKRAAGGRVLASNIAIPSEAQAKAGNYSKDHVSIQGLNLTIENAKGQERSGVGKDGKRWSVKMPASYGYVKGTNGADDDHLDIYLGPHVRSDKVFVINQIDADTKQFDEHKVLLCFGSLQQAINTYCKGFSDGKGAQRIGSIVPMTIKDFKIWLAEGNTKKPHHGLQKSIQSVDGKSKNQSAA